MDLALGSCLAAWQEQEEEKASECLRRPLGPSYEVSSVLECCKETKQSVKALFEESE